MKMPLNDEYFMQLNESEYHRLLSLPPAQMAKEVNSIWPQWELPPDERKQRARTGPPFPGTIDLQRRWRKSRWAREYAKGFQETDPLGNQITGWPEYNGGIIMPQPEDLKIGQRYFRIVDSAAPHHIRISGAWWLEFNTIKSIAEFARDASSPREAVQYFCAVYLGNSRCDKLVHGILDMPLKAYTGKGREFHAEGKRFIPPQHLEVKQLCIPGMRDHYETHMPCYEKAMSGVTVFDIWSSEFFRRN